MSHNGFKTNYLLSILLMNKEFHPMKKTVNKKGKMPSKMAPMLGTFTKVPPTDSRYIWIKARTILFNDRKIIISLMYS
jgi:hypothetical protein